MAENVSVIPKIETVELGEVEFDEPAPPYIIRVTPQGKFDIKYTTKRHREVPDDLKPRVRGIDLYIADLPEEPLFEDAESYAIHGLNEDFLPLPTL